MTNIDVEQKDGNWHAALSMQDKDGYSIRVDMHNIPSKEKAVELIDEKLTEFEQRKNLQQKSRDNGTYSSSLPKSIINS